MTTARHFDVIESVEYGKRRIRDVRAELAENSPKVYNLSTCVISDKPQLHPILR